MSLAGKTLFITGASRGIGLAMAKRAAQDGANIAIAESVAAETASAYEVVAGSAVIATVVGDGLLGIALGSKYWHVCWFQSSG